MIEEVLSIDNINILVDERIEKWYTDYFETKVTQYDFITKLDFNYK